MLSLLLLDYLFIMVFGLGVYISIAFVAVWKVQAKAYSICMISGAAFDFLIFEFALEFFISIIYLGRKNNEVFRRIGEFLNRARNYRCLWP